MEHTDLDARLAALVREARASGTAWADVERALRSAADDARLRAGQEGAADGAGTPAEAVRPAEAGSATAAHTAAGPTATAQPTEPERTAKIGPVTLFTEMAALEKAGRRGWRVVGSGSSVHVVAHTEQQWEFRRVFASRRTGRALEADGWQRFSPGWFPWGYYQRPTGRAPEADDVVGGYRLEL